MLVLLAAVLVGGCAGLPPGANYPKTASVALAQPELTRLGAQFASAALEHEGKSGFRIITVGVDGFATRVQMIDAAERTLDLQYYIFRGDETGRLLTDALVRAADRGVRIRVLIDDGDTAAGDEQLFALVELPTVEIRVFNPFAYRGHARALRVLEFLLRSGRLDYRMHNKLLVTDNSIALMGGRNVGNQYFQMDPDSQFADDDVFVAGPIASQLSAEFDEFWNSAFAIPAQALKHKVSSVAALRERAKGLATPSPTQAKTGQLDYVARSATGEPYAGLLSGRLPLAWAHAKVLADSPDKKNVERGVRGGTLMGTAVNTAVSTVQSELLMITPYFIPADEDLRTLQALRQRDVHVRILTNSLESTRDPVAHSGYMHYRVSLLHAGMEVYEVRSLLGNGRGSGQTAKISRFGTYGLHAKLTVFDRQRLFIGSMNFDQRSKRLNTEVGLIIDSPELADQTATRFEGMTQLDNAYTLALRRSSPGSHARLVWDTREEGKPVEYTREPARNAWKRWTVGLLSLLPLGREL